MDAISKKILAGLTPAQEKAADILDKNLQIIACAGAGKTRTITMRIINLIAHGVDPGSIVAITFTRKAAAEMKGRIYKAGNDLLGNTEGFADMFIGTIDSFCFKMLQENVDEYAKFSVLDEVQSRIFLEKFSVGSDKTGLAGSVIDKAPNLQYKDQTGKKYNYYTQLMSLLNSTYYNREYSRRWSDDVKARLAKYNKCLADNKYFDFSMLIREMIERLDPDSESNGGTVSEFGRKIFEKVRYLIIDEYQDTNPVQEHLAHLFCTHGTNICVVGDCDQTIYQFRGSDENNILEFEKNFDAVVVNLNENFRSTEGVIDIANCSVAANHEGDSTYRKTVRGKKSGDVLEYQPGDTVWEGFESFAEEVDFIASQIVKLHASGIPLSEIAILLRNRTTGQLNFQQAIMEKLKEANIECAVEGLNLLDRTNEYKASRSLFEYIRYKYFPYEHDPENAVETTLDMVEQYWVIIGGKDNETQKALSQLDKTMTAITSKKKAFGHDLNMQQIFQDFIGNYSFIESTGNAVEKTMYNLGKFSKIIADYELLFFTDDPGYKMSRFITHLGNVVPGLYPEGEVDNALIRGDAVRLMTIHQSKGLEFAAVFIPTFVNGILPGNRWERYGKIYGPVDALDEMAKNVCIPNAKDWIPNYELYAGSREADRKLLYVALTRAKKYLFITYSNKHGTKTCNPSDFLSEIKTSPYLKRYRDIHPDDNFDYPNDHLPGMDVEPVPIVLNFSLLSNYFDCPYRFKISNFYGFVQPYKDVQGYGKMLHEIMMQIHRAWIDHESLTDERVDEIVDKALYLPFANSVQLANSRVGATGCAKAYIEQNKADADRMIASEMEINIEMGDGISVNGRIDLVRTFDDNGTDKVAIVDLKSAGHDAEQCLNAEQLKIYAIGYMENTGKLADRLMIYNLDAPDGSKNRSQPVSTSDIKDTKKKIVDAADNIRRSDLPRCKGSACDSCYVKGLCHKEVSKDAK